MPDNAAALPVLPQEAYALLPVERPEPFLEWMDTQELADLAGIHVRKARGAAANCYNGGTWRGVCLEVRYEGRSLMIHGPSLPHDLRDIWHERYKSSQETQKPEPVTLDSPDEHSTRVAENYALARWKLNLIAPALQLPKYSKGRGNAIKAIVGREFTQPNGKPFTPAISTLQAWLKAFEEGGEQALNRKEREKEDGPRVLISRDWDKNCPLSDEKKAEIAAHMCEHVKSLWGKGAPGWRRINQLASIELFEQCRAAGWKEAKLKDCEPGRSFVERFREWVLVAIKERNAKLFFDKHTPRIQRTRKGYKPGDIVIGDVHPHDVVRKIDGREVHARLICWLDVATYDIFVSIVILPPGRGIRQEDIAASFVDMVQAWGLPRQLRLDNGSEYKWDTMIKGFQALAGLFSAFQAFHVSIMGDGEAAELIDNEQFHAVSRARPYNAPAKQIEHVFGIIEYLFFSMMTGWIGGDRMNKRTQIVGQDPVAHEGSDDEYEKDMSICLDLYRNTPQKDGSSPNDKRREAIAAGWHRIGIARQDLVFAFSEVSKYKVHTGGIHIENQWYRANVLMPLIGRNIEIRYAKWAREHIYYLDKERVLHAIPAADAFLQEDGKGAKEQSRLNGIKLQQVRDLKAQTKSIDLIVEAARYNAALPPPPVLPVGPAITTVQGEAIAKALENANAPQIIKLLPGQFIHPTEGYVVDIPPVNEQGPKPIAIDFDPLQFALPVPETQKPNPEEPEFDPIKALINPMK